MAAKIIHDEVAGKDGPKLQQFSARHVRLGSR